MLTEGAVAVDSFAELIGKLDASEMQRIARIVANADWREVPGRSYDTADVQFWEPCNRAFLIRIFPLGEIPRHHDLFIEGETHHFVYQTNDSCENGWIDTNGVERSMHMQQGCRYRVERSPLHWAYNRGNTDRIHLLVEFA